MRLHAILVYEFLHDPLNVSIFKYCIKSLMSGVSSLVPMAHGPRPMSWKLIELYKISVNRKNSRKSDFISFKVITFGHPVWWNNRAHAQCVLSSLNHLTTSWWPLNHLTTWSCKSCTVRNRKWKKWGLSTRGRLRAQCAVCVRFTMSYSGASFRLQSWSCAAYTELKSQVDE